MPSTSTPERPRSDHRPPPLATTDARPKRLLFCTCGREAPPHAWRAVDDGGRRLVCPDCAATLTVR